MIASKSENTPHNEHRAGGLFVQALDWIGSTTLDGASYTYDNAGNRTSKTDYLASVTSNYSYDNLYQLTQVTQGSSTTESYSYDAVGNRLSSLGVSPYAYNSSNELTSTPSATYTYDHNGNTTTKTDSSGTTTYNWDTENRLTSVVLPGSGGTVSFKYDPFGRRIQKSSASGTVNYVYDGFNLLEDADSSGNVIARYTHGNAVDEDLAMLRSGTTSYYQQDGPGSVTSLSNSAGALAQTYIYDGFGKVTSSTGALVNPFQYTGREFDSDAGIYYYRARYLDPTAGRFLSEDHLRFEQGSNFYSYVGNNPLNWVDPSGNRCYLRTPNGFSEVPCANKCLGNVCNVAPIGPPPPPLPPSPSAKGFAQAIALLTAMSNCSRQRQWEILDIWDEATNGAFISASEGPGKSLVIQAAETGAHHAGWKPLANALSWSDFAAGAWDIGWESYEYHEFKQKLRGAKQRECECIDKAIDKIMSK